MIEACDISALAKPFIRLILLWCYFSYANLPPLCHYIQVITQKSRSDYDEIKLWASPSLLGAQHRKKSLGVRPHDTRTSCPDKLRLEIRIYLHTNCNYLLSFCSPTYLLVLILFTFYVSIKLKYCINTLHIRDTEYSPLNYFQCIPFDLLLKTTFCVLRTLLKSSLFGVI